MDLKTEFREWRLQNKDAGAEGFELKYLELQTKYEEKLIVYKRSTVSIVFSIFNSCSKNV